MKTLWEKAYKKHTNIFCVCVCVSKLSSTKYITRLTERCSAMLKDLARAAAGAESRGAARARSDELRARRRGSHTRRHQIAGRAALIATRLGGRRAAGVNDSGAGLKLAHLHFANEGAALLRIAAGGAGGVLRATREKTDGVGTLLRFRVKGKCAVSFRLFGGCATLHFGEARTRIAVGGDGGSAALIDDGGRTRARQPSVTARRG